MVHPVFTGERDFLWDAMRLGETSRGPIFHQPSFLPGLQTSKFLDDQGHPYFHSSESNCNRILWNFVVGDLGRSGRTPSKETASLAPMTLRAYVTRLDEA